MENGWFNRLLEVVAGDPRSMKTLSESCGFGRNYVQQMVRNGKEPGAGHLAALLDQLGPRAALYVFTGLDLSDEDREFLAALGRMTPGLRQKAVDLFSEIATTPRPPAQPPSDPH